MAAGDTIWVMPDTYTEQVTMKAGVALRGMDTTTVVLRAPVTAGSTYAVIMATNSLLQDVTVSVQTALGTATTLVGILFPGSTPQTAEVRGVTLVVDNSAVATSTSVLGMWANGTTVSGGTDSGPFVLDDETSITVRSQGLGTKRGILISGAVQFRTANTNVACVLVGAAGSGTQIGIETTNGGANFTIERALVLGSSADISQTAGSLLVGETVRLRSPSANGKGFGTIQQGKILFFTFTGTTAAAAHYMYPGTSATGVAVTAGTSAPTFYLTRNCVLHNLIVTDTGIGVRDQTISVQVGSTNIVGGVGGLVSTALTATLADTAFASDTLHSVAVSANMYVAVLVTPGASGSESTGLSVQLEYF